MMIHKINPSVEYNKWLKRLKTQLIKPTNQNSIKAPLVVKPKNKFFFETLGTSIMNSPVQSVTFLPD